MMCGGVPVAAPTKAEHACKITPETIESLITPKTKAIIIPYPNNPTGAILTRNELESIAQVLEKTEILVISDEIYSELTYGRLACEHCFHSQYERENHCYQRL